MKVIFVTREGYNLAGGRIRAYNFARELSRHGVETRVLSYAQDLGAKDGIYEEEMGSFEKLKHNISAYKELSREKEAVIVIQRINYHSFAPLLTYIIKRNSLVLDLDDWEMREDPRYIFGFYPTSKAEWLTRKIASLSSFCIAASLYLKDYIKQFNKKIYYIPSCVDANLFKPVEKNKKEDIIKFVWTGTLHRRHDVENVIFVIDCFKELRKRIGHVSLDIVGDGIYTKEVLPSILNDSMNGSIRYIGWVEPDRMPNYLESIDVGLFPLIQNTRFNLSKSPVKLFEYMAMEKSTVSSCIGEAGEIVDDGSDGFLAKDRRDFINKMEILARDSELREEMGKNARVKVVKDYSLNVAGGKLLDALKDCLCK